MKVKDAITEVRHQWRDLISIISGPAQMRVNGEPSFICPLCGHGTHGDGISYNPKSSDKNGLHCFGCNFDGDIIDLYMKVNNVSFKEALDVLAEWLCIEIDKPTQDKAPSLEAPQGQRNYTDYYKQCQNRIKAPEAVAYLKKRGISLETAEAWGLGFDPAADPAGKGYAGPRIIIPVTEGYYVARSIDPNISDKFKAVNPKGSTIDIFNRDILFTAAPETPVFITEGVFDALSFLETGFNAISINSASNAERLIKVLEEQGTEVNIILCLDNDTQGKRAADVIQKGLKRLNIPFINADMFPKVTEPENVIKDANELIQKNRDLFIRGAQKAVKAVEAKPDNVSAYIDNTMTGEIKAFRNDIKTGFSNLDEQCGGLYPGLYVVAAISSLGKTTFTHQLSDQIAAAGNDVLFFSLEQSRLEMVTKSLARITAEKDMFSAVTARQIQNRETLTPQVLEAAAEYKSRVADRLSIIEGNFNCDVSFIGNYLRRYIARNNVTPVIVVDYLQILQPAFEGMKRQTVKEAIDSTVTELKRISREHSTPVIVVSSVNRVNYLTPIDFESLKESGNIEYTADVIWGLQLSCLNNDPLFDKEKNISKKRHKIAEEKARTPREIDLICLKNRYGISSYTCSFDYYPKHDLFKPSTRAHTLKEIFDKHRNGGGEPSGDNPSWGDSFTKPPKDNPKPKQEELDYKYAGTLPSGNVVYEITRKENKDPEDNPF